MKSHVRAAVAAIALAHAGNRKVGGVYDYSQGGHRNIDVTVNGSTVTAYDYASSCHIDGGLPSLCHYGESAHIDLTPNGAGRFEGYDYGTSSHFEVTVRGADAEIYDYGESAHFTYSL